MRRQSRVEALQDVWLFEQCNRKELATIASEATPVSVPADKVLAREGAPGSEFFIILSGKAEATRNGTPIATFGPGSFFGEMALLDRQPRVATVVATEPMEVLVITSQAFTNVVETMPTVDRKMLVVLAQRLRELENRFLPDGERRLAS
jgi:CRP/FNR family cyclic AMP-dependent transcriptional regulator